MYYILIINKLYVYLYILFFVSLKAFKPLNNVFRLFRHAADFFLTSLIYYKRTFQLRVAK